MSLYLGTLQLFGNFHTVIPGEFYRSAQISANDIIRYKNDYHIQTIINLRGKNIGTPWYATEVQTAKQQGITLIDFPLSAQCQTIERINCINERCPQAIIGAL